jgi:hypothetical protein
MVPPANDETGKILRAQWLGALDEIADLELQRRTWLDPANRNPHWSYIEFVCRYPDADQLKDGQRQGWLSPAEAKILLEFGQVLIAHKSPTGDDYDNEAIVDDPAWHKVVRAAQVAQQQIATSAHLSSR